ncbi:MAG: 50S ribosomal protein L21 [Solirubrobacterales bacterium]
MYAVIKSGSRQYKVEPGTTLFVDRISGEEGDKVLLDPVMFRSDDEVVVDASELEKVKVEAVIRGQVRGPKIRVVKFKAKKGYRRHQGHRSEQTRLEVSEVKKLSRKPTKKKDDA